MIRSFRPSQWKINAVIGPYSYWAQQAVFFIIELYPGKKLTVKLLSQAHMRHWSRMMNWPVRQFICPIFRYYVEADTNIGRSWYPQVINSAQSSSYFERTRSRIKGNRYVNTSDIPHPLRKSKELLRSKFGINPVVSFPPNIRKIIGRLWQRCGR